MRERWLKFVHAYMELDNGTKAAIKAGYSETSAHSQATRLLKHGEIIAAIAKARERAAVRNEVTLDSLIAECELAQKLALEGSPVLDRYGKPSLDDSGNFKTKLELPSYLKASELKAKLTGFLVEKRQDVTKPIDQMTEEELRVELAKGADKLGKLKLVK